MGTQWYCLIGGQQYGPVAEEVLKTWIAQGRLGAADRVWRQGLSDWQSVGNTFGIPATAVPPALPHASAAAPPPVPPPMPPPQVVYMRPAPTAPGAIGSLICGIASIFFHIFGLILGPIAIGQARKASKAIAANPGAYTGEGLATAGRITGIVGTVLGVFGIFFIIVWLGFAGFMVFQTVHAPVMCNPPTVHITPSHVTPERATPPPAQTQGPEAQ